MAWYDNITYLSSNPFLSMGNIRNPVLSDAFHSNNPLRNNQNINNQNNSGLQWWMNNDRSRWPVSGTNVMPDNLTQDLGAATYRGPLPSVVDESRIPGRIQEELPTKKGFQLPNFGITGILQGLKDQFEYRPATEEAWDPNTGQFVSAEEQDKMNALGGYYSDAARNQRRQRARVINMIKRRDADKGYSEKNLQRLIDLGYGPKETITTTSVGDNINQGGGGYDRGYTQSQRAGVEAYHGRGGGKEMMSQGGRIGYATRGFVDPEEPAENIFEFMQDQGVPYGQMASAEGIPFMWEEFLAAKELDPDLTYENFLDAIDKSPSDFYAQGGIVGLL